MLMIDPRLCRPAALTRRWAFQQSNNSVPNSFRVTSCPSRDPILAQPGPHDTFFPKAGNAKKKRPRGGPKKLLLGNSWILRKRRAIRQ